jgi:hypothetical protein
MRKFLIGVAAVVGFGAVAGIAAVLATRAPRSPTQPVAPPALPPEVAPAAPQPLPAPSPGPAAFSRQQLLPPGASAEPPPPPPVVMGPPRPEPPRDSWEAVPPAARPGDLGPVGAALGRGLNELQDKVSGCYDEVVQARYGQRQFTTVRDYAPLDDTGTTVLMLEVETQHGSVRIVDAPVETRGGASDGLIACAQQALRGQVVPAPQAVPGSRHRVRYPLRQ